MAPLPATITTNNRVSTVNSSNTNKAIPPLKEDTMTTVDIPHTPHSKGLMVRQPNSIPMATRHMEALPALQVLTGQRANEDWARRF